ncbi:MAG: PucR family transcriptional regulator ligand-binding domain-containing protein [Eubacteriales bacterium]|nr:PucR family transcriptional regulator ligand-binding domain-containing protein [Eubacteriales bacterium]
MAILLRSLIKEVSNMDITLVAGESGMNTPVSWVHMVETVDATSFLDGGEVAFVTGIGLSKQDTILDLISNIHDRNAAGVFVNLGPFIDSIPEAVIKYCNEKEFPLFTVPWKIHLAEIIRKFSCEITKDDQKHMQISSSFMNALFFPEQEHLYITPLAQYGFQPNWQYAVCMLKFTLNDSTDIPYIERLTLQMERFLKHYYNNYAVFRLEESIIIIMADYTEDEVRELVAKIFERSRTYCSPDALPSIGCGRLTQSLRCIYKSFQQAKSITNLQERKKISKSNIFYSDMGIYRLLMSVTDTDAINYFCNETIMPLVDYDKTNNSNLTEVLRKYLQNNGSVIDTANEMYVHRNTINYKLKKIEEILDVDLSSLDFRIHAALGLYLLDLL